MDRRTWSLPFALAVALLLVAATASIAVPVGTAVAGPDSATFDGPESATFDEPESATFDGPESAAFGDPFFQTDGAAADDILLEASIDEDGDAVWTVEYRFRLTDNESRTAFEELETEIAQNETPYVDRFRDRMTSTVSTAEESTGREMSVSNVMVDTRRQTLGREYGVVAYSFTWGGFAATEGDAILAGDAVAGLFLDADSQFVLGWPEGYETTSVTPDPSRSTPTTVIWDGPFEFGSDEPRIRLEPAPPGEPTPTPTPTDSGTGPTDSGPTDPGDATEPADPSESPISGGLVAVVVAIVVTIGLLVFSRRRGESPDTIGDAGSGPSTGAAGAAAAGSSGGSGASDVDADSSDSGAGDGPAATASEDSPPDELLSPEERVMKLVREHDGRIKQQEVVREMDWTDARTSQVVGSLREEGKLESFRLGRENVLKLPDQDGEDGPPDR